MEPKFILRFIMFNHVYFIGERFEFNFKHKKATFQSERKLFKLLEICGYCI